MIRSLETLSRSLREQRQFEGKSHSETVLEFESMKTVKTFETNFVMETELERKVRKCAS